MTSETGVLKIGIADDPLRRMKAVQVAYPIITGFYQAWGMSRREAEFVERMVHRRLFSVRHENELFKIEPASAALEIEVVIKTLGFTATMFEPLPLPALKPPKIRKKRGRPPTVPKSVFQIRLDKDARAEAERAAKKDGRTLTNWIVNLVACELAALERGELPASINRQ